jgi:hypothetical protein
LQQVGCDATGCDARLEHDGGVERGELDFVLGEQIDVQPLGRQEEEQRAATNAADVGGCWRIL